MGKLSGYLDQNTLADVCHEYGKNYGDCHFPAGIHLKLCSVCVRKTALYWQGSHFPRLYCDYRIAVASLHGASVCAVSKLHLVNTHMSIIMLQAFSAFGVFLMRQFYAGIPDELCEASRIDGLSEYGIWAKVMLPLSKPAISTLIIFTFVGTWNDFLGPYIYLTKTELKTIQIGLRLFISQYTAEYGLIMAGSVITLIPVIIIFLSLQKYFVQGVAASGIKG